MPLSIPAFDQYQQPLVPLRGLWNAKPAEGDRYVNVEIDWLVTTKASAVQFSLSGNSAVSLTQIAALAVDNGRSGADVSFIFPDSGWQLTVAAHAQGVFPVFTNALMFYASAPGAAAGDTTVVQILNSIPPPIPVQPTQQQNHASVAGIPLGANASFPVIAAGINGTLNTFTINVSAVAPAGGGYAAISLSDGAGHFLWQTTIAGAASTTQDFTFAVPGLASRFLNGLNLVIGGPTTFTGDWAVCNVYFTVP